MSDKKDTTPQITRIELFLGKYFDFKRNEINQRVEFRLKNQKEYKELNLDSLYRLLLKNGFNIKLDLIRSLLKSDFVKDYNPIKNYFESLPKWDGKIDHIKILASHMTAEDQEFFNEMFKKALVRSIACTLDNIVNRIVMVFVSKQELGKSWFIRKLNPFGNKYYSELPLREDKDTMFRFAETFIYNLEELASLNSKEINHLKAIISMATIDERKPYAIDSIVQPRRCNFWGSTNRPEFLVDTENTRWLPIAITEIDKSYSETTDYHKVWSQAFTLYKQGYDYNLNDKEKKKRDEINQQYEISYPEKDIVSMYLQPCNEDAKGSKFMNYMEIMDYLHKEIVLRIDFDKKSVNPIKIGQYALTKALTALGFKKGRKWIGSVQVRGYFVMLINRNKYSDGPPQQPLFDNDDVKGNNTEENEEEDERYKDL